MTVQNVTCFYKMPKTNLHRKVLIQSQNLQPFHWTKIVVRR